MLHHFHFWQLDFIGFLKAAAGLLSQPRVPNCNLSLTRKSWCWSAVHWHNQLPPTLRSEKKEKVFKTRLKAWVSENVGNVLEAD